MLLFLEIEAQILEIQAKKATLAAEAEENGEGDRISMMGSVMDQDIYSNAHNRFAGYVTSIAANEEADQDVSFT